MASIRKSGSNGPPQAQAAPSATGADNLAGTSWLLATLDGQPALADTMATLHFEAGMASGSGGCNCRE